MKFKSLSKLGVKINILVTTKKAYTEWLGMQSYYILPLFLCVEAVDTRSIQIGWINVILDITWNK